MEKCVQNQLDLPFDHKEAEGALLLQLLQLSWVDTWNDLQSSLLTRHLDDPKLLVDRSAELGVGVSHNLVGTVSKRGKG